MMDLAICQGNALSGYESFGHAANIKGAKVGHRLILDA